jgi:hypothetical protein
MGLRDNIPNHGPSVYTDSDFRSTFEALIPYLRSSKKTTTALVNEHHSYVYDGDFYGYCLEMNVPRHLHYFFMRINRFLSPYDFRVGCKSILVPSYEEIESIVIAYKSGK